ncbi:NAD-dependent epimerase/dehydratase family protein [Pelosinus fermentans]|uniref:NAD-dependent epimerase/dehydratase n=1 Tax=Pelosinus fermentans JBW45 TaxID=1192197 RepID=I9NP58_9FIRM|nr:NAD(P)-dependent oxidoreductase [Pelosinus fermentans]AJQ26087.1 NAD-dependent epimerase/dehydratase [Pelosinus fermentans JBW45]
MNILLTGTTGFIGSNLLTVLTHKQKESENNIIILSHRETENSPYIYIDHKNYQFVKEDFLEKKIENIDIIIHLGAFTPKNSQQANNVDKCISNIINTQYLCANLPSIPKKMIFISTLDVYMNSNEPITEDTPTIPCTLYGQSKLFCEKMLEQWAIENQVVLQILRVGHIYGKGEGAYHKIIPVSIKEILLDHNPVIISNGSEKRSFLNVVDCCNLIMKAVELKEYKGPINLVSNQSISILELVQMLIDISKKNILPHIKNENIKTKDFIFNNAKMIKYLGMETISIRVGLEEEYEYFKSNKI